MSRNAFQLDLRDRARSAAATVALYLIIGAIFLTGHALRPKLQTDDSLKIFDVKEPAPRELPPIREPELADTIPAPAGREADPSPIVAPPARLPSPQPIIAASVAGAGSSSSAGAATVGSGTGAGGAGIGRGGSGIGTEARLLSGNRSRLPRALLRPFAADRGYAHLLLTVDERGRVTACLVMEGTGSGAVDDALCQVMMGQSRWTSARDPAGRPITVQVRYTAIWSKD